MSVIKALYDAIESRFFQLPKNQRFQFNAENFVVRCHNLTKYDNNTKTDNRLLYDWAYADIVDHSKPENIVLNITDLPRMDEYGFAIEDITDGDELVATTQKQETPTGSYKLPYSISILGFDSASRNQWFRHMPRSVEFMDKLGFVTLYGYNKVRDFQSTPKETTIEKY